MALLEPTNLLLLACALIYLLIGEPADAGILLVFVVGIALLDAVQEWRSSRALQELARLSAPKAHVRRGAIEAELPAERVQLGDLLRLEEGDRVAADGRLTEAVGLWLDESLLTGESLPVAKQHPGERVLAGSLVSSGRGWAEVVAVAEATELGLLGKNLASVQPPLTRLQRSTRRLTARLSGVAIALCVAMALMRAALSGDWPQALLAALALALAVLPNEIPVVVALFLALGSLRLARIGVLARWPAAVESLGTATVLAVDKTGTLTENRMGVERLLTWPGQEAWRGGLPLQEPCHGLVEMAVLASRGDPVDAMELAIQRFAATHLRGSDHLHPDWPLQRDYPLQADLLVFSQLWRDGQGAWQLAAKGAPEAIADLCHLPPQASSDFLALADSLAAEGLRVIAVARGVDGVLLHGGQPAATQGDPPAALHDYLFEPLGFIGLADPLRQEVPQAMARARAAGLRVVMITGDSPATARSIADQAGIPAGAVLTGRELATRPSADLARLVEQTSVFARVLPQHKLQLVQALQASGQVVAMTGDGVNDAAALKAADIGVAMGQRGTAVARESADLVLLHDSFSSLVEAIALGRRIDANLHRALAYTLAIHLPIAALGLLPLLFGQTIILLPVHIALLHLVIDPACTVVFEALPPAPGLMRQPPRAADAPLFGAAIWRRALGQGVVLLVAALVLAHWPQIGPESRRSLVFGLLLLASGGLVGLNGGLSTRHALAGTALGLALWLALLAFPVLQQGLSLTPLTTPQMATVVITASLSLGLIGLFNRSLA